MFTLHAELEDYTGDWDFLYFESGTFETAIWIYILDDNVWEPDEMFCVTLNSTGIASVKIPNDTAKVTILDDDGM